MHRKILEAVLSNSRAGYWDWDYTNAEKYVSDSFKQLLGYEPHEIENTVAAWRELLVDEENDPVYQRVVNEITDQGQDRFSVECRFKHKNGNTVFVSTNGLVIARAENGTPERIIGSHIDVTEQKLITQKLERTQKLLHKTNEAALIGGWEVDLINNKIYWTTVTKKIHEVPEDFEPDLESALSFFDETSKELVTNAFNKAIETGEGYDLELQLITAKGNYIWTRSIAYPEMHNGKCIRIHGSFQDITMYKDAQEELLLKQQQLSSFIEYSPAAMAMFDNDMKYIAASNKWMDSYKLDGEVIGKSHYEVFPEISDEWKELHQRALKGETLKNDGEPFERLDGTTDWLRWDIRPWYESRGKIGGMVMLTEVITEQVRAKEELVRAKEQAEAASESKASFLSTMSHEIRTPMNAVIGLTHILLENPREDQLKNLKTLKYSAENLLVLINDILDFSKIEAGKIVLEEAHFSLKDVLRNTRLILLQQAQEKNIDLKLMLDSDMPELVIGDPVRIGQVVTNLVSNAIKFTQVGKVTIKAELERLQNNVATIKLEVIDTGIGIPKDKQQHIFESFSQATDSTTRQFGGTGLGLAISKRLLNIMGADLKVESESGKGSNFYFTLEIPVSEKKVRQQKSVIEQTEQKSLKGLKLLVAEDNNINVYVLKKFLKKWDVECDLAENGLIAVELVKTNNYDLVLMDLHMPELDGYGAVSEIRALPGDKYKNLPIVALTASATATSKDNTKNSGMNGFVTKPFNPNDLHQVLSKYYKGT